MITTKHKFKRGDRVQREIDVFDCDKGMKTGTIAFKYGYRAACLIWHELDLGYYPELYAVRWDNEPDYISKGYFGYGLKKLSPLADCFIKLGSEANESLKRFAESIKLLNQQGHQFRFAMRSRSYQLPKFTFRDHLEDCFGFLTGE